MIKKVKRGWRVDFWMGTNRVRRTWPTKRIAQAYETQEKHAHLEGKFIPSTKKDRTPFYEFADEFYQVHCLTNMVNPEKTVFYHIQKLNAYFKGKTLGEITQHDIEMWKANFSTRVNPATVNRQMDTLRSLFAKAVDWGRLDKNPVLKVKRLRMDNQRVRFLTEQEIKRLYEASKSRVSQFLTVALNTGMRRSNLVNLCWEDIDFKNRVIHVLKTKSGKAYEVPINNQLFELLRDLAKTNPTPTGPVLDTTNLRRDFRTALRKASIKNCTIHDIRHSFASHLAMKGIDIYTISQLLGHSDIKMTQRYAHLAPNHKKIAVNMINFTPIPKQNPKEEVKSEPSLKRDKNYVQI